MGYKYEYKGENIGPILNPNSQKERSKLINHKEVINAQMNQTMENMKKGGNPIIYYRKYVLEILNE